MKKILIVIIILFILVLSCKKPKINNINITQIKDTYALKNGSNPITNYYLVEGFNDNKKKIKELFETINKNYFYLFEKNNNSGICILNNRNNIQFEDGYPLLKDNLKFYISLSLNKKGLFSTLITDHKQPKSTLKFIRTENDGTKVYENVKLTGDYSINNNNGVYEIKFSYKKFNLKVLQKFINIVSVKSDMSKPKTFYLLNEVNTIECEITFLKNSKTNLYDVFKINFF